MGSRWAVLLLTAACARGGSTPDDSSVTDAPACETATWYADLDGDGHGDSSASMMTCAQPARTSATADDCDDADPQRYVGAPEICDGADNDCNATTIETCPGGCTAIRRPAPDDARVYLMCSGVLSWFSARTACAAATGFHLLEIADAAENAWVRSTATTMLGAVDLHIGGSDAVEGMWTWDGGTQFWQGGSGGAAVGGKYANWASGEPNDDGTEDCAEMKPAGNWNDADCGDGQRYVCRR